MINKNILYLVPLLVGIGWFFYEKDILEHSPFSMATSKTESPLELVKDSRPLVALVEQTKEDTTFVMTDDTTTQMDIFAPCKHVRLAGGIDCVDQDPFKDWPVAAIESEGYANPVMAAAAAKYYFRKRDRENGLKWAFRASALDAKNPDALTHIADRGLFTHSSVKVPGSEKTYRIDVMEDRYVTEYVLYHLDRASLDNIGIQEKALKRVGYDKFPELKARALQTLNEMARIEREVVGTSWIDDQLTAGGGDEA